MPELSELQIMIELLKEVMNDPMLLTFAGVWVLGYMLKKYTRIDNNFIPWIVVLSAAGLSLVIIEFSIAGFIVGAVIGYIQLGLYEQTKATMEIYKKSSYPRRHCD
ncbi:phage holin family protein [Proteinivorax hydrogeniformans]|uniref:Phage holin family protein n=1 Tax=Proteinivorax hydrogeniformans TaxID=1826727 RepID=A0AAU8HVF6_9FIRM